MPRSLALTMTAAAFALSVVPAHAKQGAPGGPDAVDALTALADNFRPRTIFLTSGYYPGDFDAAPGQDALDRADEICNLAATAVNAVVPEGDYIAVLSTTEVDFASRVGVTMGPIVNSRGDPVAENVTALLSTLNYKDSFEDYHIVNPLSDTPYPDEAGEREGDVHVWTGSQPNGRAAHYDPAKMCSNWTTASSAKTGVGTGYAASRTQSWITVGNPTTNPGVSCDSLYRLYCIQK